MGQFFAMFGIISNVYSKLDEKRCKYITYIYIYPYDTFQIK